MSELDELKKAMKTNTDAISALIQAESNSARIKQEIASNNRVLEGLHEKIKTAQAELDTVKADATRIKADASKHANDVLSSASVAKIEADNSLSRAKLAERSMQAKLDEAGELKAKYQSGLAEVTAQKDKLKAALV